MTKKAALQSYKKEVISKGLLNIDKLKIDINTPCNKIETVLFSSNGTFVLGYDKQLKKYYVSYIITEFLITKMGSVGWYKMDREEVYIK